MAAMSSDEELHSGAMPDAHKEILEHNLDNLAARMSPELVLAELVKRGVFDQQHRAMVLHEVIPLERNRTIVEHLKTSGDKFHVFVACLRAIDHAHGLLADSLAPVKQRVLWFAPSPSAAAAVVHALAKCGRGKLSDVEGRKDGRKFLIRRGFFDPQATIELLLVFPIDPRSVGEAMTVALRELGPSVNTAVMSGGYECVPGGEVNMTVNQNVDVKLKDALSSKLSAGAARWMPEQIALLQTLSRLHYEACWLVRLLVEIETVKSDPSTSSPWLRVVGWDASDTTNLTPSNSSLLSSTLSHWSDGSLTAHLLQSRSCYMQPSSLLGMLSNKQTKQYVKTEAESDAGFPGDYKPPSFPLLHFSSSDALHDRETTQFLQQVAMAMPGKPAIVCKSGAFQLASERVSEATSSCCVLIEALVSLLQQ